MQTVPHLPGPVAARRESGVDRSSKLAFHMYVRHVRLDVCALFRSKINQAASFCTYVYSPPMICISVLKQTEAPGKKSEIFGDILVPRVVLSFQAPFNTVSSKN